VYSDKEKVEASKLFSRAVYASGTAFTKHESPEWRTYYTFVIPTVAACLPSAYQLSHSLLNHEYAAVMEENKCIIAAGSLKVLACDGWSDVTLWSRSECLVLLLGL